jgi:exodeoxyribonuclease V alpha subunit
MTVFPSPEKIETVLAERDSFSPMDRHFGRFIGRLARNHRGPAALAAALVSRAGGAGHTCLDLDAFGGRPLPDDSGTVAATPFICPELAAWRQLLLESGVAGTGNKATPLVLSGNRLYLHRFWQDEKIISSFIRERGKQRVTGLHYGQLRDDLQRFFPSGREEKTDWQQVAAIAALTGSFTVISGGPGTGKTSTAAKILALFSRQHKGKAPPRILLGAPTGKAAARLQEAISASNLLPAGSASPQATTLHRLLGSRADSAAFRHNRSNPLRADIVLIDEASMVDLVLMARLMEAVPASARLILLGDHQQLASVQPGSVLGDICQPAAMQNFSAAFRSQVAELSGSRLPPGPGKVQTSAAHPLHDCLVELVKTYRFAPESAISKLSAAIRRGDGPGALAVLRQGGDGTVSWSEIQDGSSLQSSLRQSGAAGRYAVPDPDPGSCFGALDDFRILSVLRRGPCGSERLNRILKELLRKSGKGKGAFWQPLLIRRNDYSLDLFNGDVGILLPNPGKKKTEQVFFREAGGTLRQVALPLLPSHETTFVMTVHKSQGSEFKQVLLILPERDAELLSRELLYTAVSRARERVEIWGRKELFAAAVTRQTARSSGLAAALWGPAPKELQTGAGMVSNAPK